MEANDRIFVAGHRGLVGSAILRGLQMRGFSSLLFRTHSELDLVNEQAVANFFVAERPEYVFLAAAKVGGILANSTYPAEFIHQNLAIQSNVIHASWKSGVKRLLFLGSSCIYPRDCPQPIREDYLLTGPLEPTNRAYALAKISGIEMCASYNKQYGTQYLAAMPTNLYGPGDNYDLAASHVLPALIRKCHEAKARGDKSVTVWGTGTPRRELLHSDDLADACVYLMSLPDAQFSPLASKYPDFPLINIGFGEDVTILELVNIVKEVVGFNGTIEWDRTKPDGTLRKLLSSDKIRDFGWRPKIALRDGIKLAYESFLGSR